MRIPLKKIPSLLRRNKTDYRKLDVEYMKSDYRFVSKWIIDGEDYFKAQVKRGDLSWACWFNTEKEAALGADKKLIEHGYPPVNILKKKL